LRLPRCSCCWQYRRCRLEQAWHIQSNAQSLVIAAGAVVSLGFLWTQRQFFQHRDKRRK
jgi:hypothetical protein